MISILDQIDSAKILEEYLKLEENIQWTVMGHKGKQAGLQYKQNEDPWTSAVGRSTGDELDCSTLNPYFANTIFEELIIKYNFKRTRLMWVNSYACYSMHKDETQRVHIPLVTNPDCYFIFKNRAPVYLKVNNVYKTDTRLPHTFMNCSEEPRLHLVGAVES
jgi:hypothetical protein